MTRRLLIDVGLFETRAAVLDQDRLTDISYYRPGSSSAVGEIYLARIRAFSKEMDAAFIDLGTAGEGFLLSRDIPAKDKKASISDRLQEGQKIILQVIKDRKGDKECQLSAFPKLESQNIVYNPAGSGLSFSKKLKDTSLKEKITQILEGPLHKAGGSVTIRSCTSDRSLGTLEREFSGLIDTWLSLEQSAKTDTRARCLRPKDPPVISAYKKYAGTGLSVSINDRSSFELLKNYCNAQESAIPSLNLWTENDLLFDAAQIEEQIESATEKRVSLPSGGNITIEQTEALIAIDVNSGSHTETRQPATLALKTNQEAARVICAQIRLRNLSGIIIIDFIQMQGKGAVGQLTRRLQELTQPDPVAVRVIGMTELGLMQLTRQRKEASLPDLLKVSLDTGSGTLPAHIASTLLRDIMRYGRSQKSANIPLKIGAKLVPLFKNKGREIENYLCVNIVWEEDKSRAAHEYQLG
ncbi:MAG: ribonuclease E/G [Sneathiella sp.]|nr:ribonuclease E/G [Sneathiella sp.]